MTGFAYYFDILARFPEVTGGVLFLKGVNNGLSPHDLMAIYTSDQIAVRQRIADTPLSDIESLAAWRAVFRGFGVDPTKYRSAAEALLRRLVKKGDIPSINALVDICNWVSIRYALPVAAFDTRQVSGLVNVKFADGAENFTPLDQTEIEHPAVGEVIFCDEAGLVIARRWCWKQSLESVVFDGTQNALITIEAQHPRARADIEAAVADIQMMIEKYLGGDVIAGLVNKANPYFKID